MRINTLVNAGGTSLAAPLRPFGAFRLLLAVGVFLGVSDVAAQGSQPSFKTEIEPILQAYCYDCHRAENGNGTYVSYETMLPTLEEGKFQSTVLSNQSMPTDASLSQAQLNLIQCWVEDGYQDN